MSKQERIELLQGTLDMLILRTLLFGPLHGHGIVHAIVHFSDEMLRVDHGSLYPALHRLQKRGWINAEWSTSSKNRRAKFYKLTAAGKKQLAVEESRWQQFIGAVARVMRPRTE